MCDQSDSNKVEWTGLLNSFVARKFLKSKNLTEKLSMRVMPELEKLDFLKTSVSWIEGKDIIDTCFVLNFGYEFPLPWPQVLIRKQVVLLQSQALEK